MAENIKVVCAWCGKHMRGDKDAAQISHGICAECKDIVTRVAQV